MSCFTCILFWIAAALIVLKLWIKLTTGWCRSNVSLVGKTAIITGANTGIGYHTAADFAKRGAKVILACRDKKRGEDAQEKLIKETDNPNIFYKHMDLASLKSVREFAAEINKCEERLDILVNNAGVGHTNTEKSEDGLLLVMQINHFGHFLLTNLLLDLLKKTPNSRIINVSSMAAKHVSSTELDDLNQPSAGGIINDIKIYSRSKLCNILFTIELARRLRDTSVTSYSLHPGAVLTDIFRTMPAYMKFVLDNIVSWFMKSSEEGAQTTIYCSVQKEIEFLSGHHFHDCHLVERYQSAQDFDLPRIGYHTAADFAKRGAKVILACRDKKRGEDAQRRLIRETDNPNIFYKHLDLASLKSVREFAAEINKSEERLDILVNNAGLGNTSIEKSEDNLLLLMQINYYGHFLLTNLFLDLLKKTPNSRIINVSSIAAKYVRSFDVDDLNQPSPGGYINDMDIYSRSKLCNVLFTIELARRLGDTTVTTYSLHPGAVLSEFFRTMPVLVKFLAENIFSWLCKNSEEGAQTTIYCSVQKDIEFLSGQHFHDCHVVERYHTAIDFDLPSKLWEVTAEMVNLKQK